MVNLERVISGGQSGSDLGGLKTAKKFGILTGGTMPRGYITLDGPKPQYAELYGISEHTSSLYPPRTFKNVKDSDGTMRLAYDFNSKGEICTLKAINQYKRPYIDINLRKPLLPQEAANWIINNNIKILNIAGNSEKTYYGTEEAVCEYLSCVFVLLGFTEHVG